MDSDCVPAGVATQKQTLTIGGIVFDHVTYDREGDVLCVRRGDATDAVDWIGTAEGDGTSHGPDGGLIGITTLNARARLEEDGKIELALPEHTIEVRDLGDALT